MRRTRNRQDSSKFKPTRGQRQVLQRFSNFVKDGGREGEKGWGPPREQPGKEDVDASADEKPSSKSKGKGRAKNQSPVDFEQLVHGSDWTNSTSDHPFKHKFEVSWPVS